MRPLLLACALLTVTAGCGDVTTAPSPDAGPVCTPDRARWDSEVRAVVERACGSCHGATPAYGSPYSLLDYDYNLRRQAAGRPVDRMHARLADGSMPPAGTPAPTFADEQLIASWASCGTRTLTEGTRLRATAPLFRPPAVAPTGTTAIELRARSYAVPQVSDRYQCFTFTNVVAADQFIRRFDVLLDHAEVLHHAVLFRSTSTDPLGDSYECAGSPAETLYTYTWAPGEDALQFPDGGLRIRPADRYILQLHYNNSRNLAGVVDRSGVRLSVGPVAGTEYGMVALGPVGFAIPARSQQRVASGCTLPAGTRVLASMPHMHQIGSGYEQTLLRGTQRTPIIALTNWSFESQYFYDLPLTLQEGDRIETACTFNNTTSSQVLNGSSTTNEMCFGFTYVTPPPPNEYCNEPLTPSMPIDLTYRPGMCSPADAPTELPLVTGALRVAPPPVLAGGEIPDGRWELAGVEYLINMARTPIGTIDPATSSLQARGQLWTSAGRVRADFLGSITLGFSAGNQLARPLGQINFDSSYVATGNALALTTECTVGAAGSTPTAVEYEVRGDDLVVGLRAQSFASITITPRYTFHRAR
ncbi:MAG: hypothetical protein JWM10_2929 [Myxococcaceae bacterium]|nr:hypothetical protein [Myxococcaceae bacterium]